MNELQQKYNKLSEQEIVELKQRLLKAEKVAEEYQKLKSTFISNISHEMRTPLNAILGFSELSQITELTLEEMLEYMKIIHSSSKELLEKIKDVIYIATLDAGEIPVEEEIISLFGLFRDIEEHYIGYLLKTPDNPVVVKIDFNNTTHTYYTGDAGKLIRILKKLIDNGIKFSNSGKVELSFSQGPDSELCFSVRDSGIGIPLDKQKVIFEPFGTAEDSYNRNYNGSGLGLTIVQKLVKLLNGRISIDSEVGKGTTIKVYLPYISIMKKYK